MWEEDDDDFIYGGGAHEAAPPAAESKSTQVFEPQPVKPIQPLEESLPLPPRAPPPPEQNGYDAEGEEINQVEEVMNEEDEGEEDDESDIEIIVESEDKGKVQGGISRDFRSQTGNRTATFESSSSAAPHLTTEYTPTPRGEALIRKTPSQPPSQSQAPLRTDPRSTTPPPPAQDPSTLPPALAPPSHPSINPSEPGTIDGRSIFEVDMDALVEKPWRRPGSDISDYFNYGFDEVSWEAYCYRRRDLGDLANHLKAAVTNFSGLPEEQIAVLPPEVRAMVMAGATSLMSGGALPHGMQQPQMMGVGVGGPSAMMHPHPHPHDMGMMSVMNGGEMQPTPGMMPGQESDGMGVLPQEGFQPGVPAPGTGPTQMIGMGPEYGMQDPSVLGMYPASLDGAATPAQPSGSGPGPGPGPVSGSLGPGISAGPVTGPGVGPNLGQGQGQGQGQSPAVGPVAGPSAPRAQAAAFRGRPAGSPMGMRGRGGFGRGRGRGMFVQDGAPPPIPVRPASPLPPGVPTGPRNQNRYKDRDGNAPAVDGLDYGGTQGGGGGSAESSDDRGNGRKRRVSPGQDEASGRSMKRR